VIRGEAKSNAIKREKRKRDLDVVKKGEKGGGGGKASSRRPAIVLKKNFLQLGRGAIFQCGGRDEGGAQGEKKRGNCQVS